MQRNQHEPGHKSRLRMSLGAGKENKFSSIMCLKVDFILAKANKHSMTESKSDKLNET